MTTSNSNNSDQSSNKNTANNITLKDLEEEKHPIIFTSFIPDPSKPHKLTTLRKGILYNAYEQEKTIEGFHPLIWDSLNREEHGYAPGLIEQELEHRSQNINNVHNFAKMLKDAAREKLYIDTRKAFLKAYKHERTIEKQPAIEWAIENKIPIYKTPADQFAIANDLKIQGKPAVEYLTEKGYDYKLEDNSTLNVSPIVSPVGIAVIYNMNIDNQPPFKWAVENNKTIMNGMSALKWATSNNKKFNNQSPIDYIVKNNIKVPAEVISDMITKEYDVTEKQKQKLITHHLKRINNGKTEDLKDPKIEESLLKIFEKKENRNLLNKLDKNKIIFLMKESKNDQLKQIIKERVQRGQKRRFFVKPKLPRM